MLVVVMIHPRKAFNGRFQSLGASGQGGATAAQTPGTGSPKQRLYSAMVYDSRCGPRGQGGGRHPHTPSVQLQAQAETESEHRWYAKYMNRKQLAYNKPVHTPLGRRIRPPIVNVICGVCCAVARLSSRIQKVKILLPLEKSIIFSNTNISFHMLPL